MAKKQEKQTDKEIIADIGRTFRKHAASLPDDAPLATAEEDEDDEDEDKGATKR